MKLLYTAGANTANAAVADEIPHDPVDQTHQVRPYGNATGADIEVAALAGKVAI